MRVAFRPNLTLMLLMLSILPLGACDSAGDDPSAPPVGGQDGGQRLDAGPRIDLGREATPCDRPELWAQCPIGSNPRVIVDGCVEGSEVTGANGETTGICTRAGECLFVCNFEDPCPCGIDRVTAEGVFCTDCRDAAACGDAVCDRGENPQICAVDCGETCVADNERCKGNARQECEENGRWATLGCRDDQVCQFGQAGQAVVTVCQTRISMGGGTFPGFGAQAIEVVDDSLGIRFRETTFDGQGVRFVQGGERILVTRSDRFAVIDPAGVEPPLETNIATGRGVVASPSRVVRPGRWPQLSEFFDDTSRTVEAMVHDGADAIAGGVAISGDDQWLATAFAVGLRGGSREPVIGIWRAGDGRLNHLLRFVDEAVVRGGDPATAVALGIDGRAAVEARQDGLLIVWNVEERRYAHLIQTATGRVSRLVPSVAGDDLLLVGGDEGAALWELNPADGGDPRRRWFAPGGPVTSLAISPDSQAVAVGVRGEVRILDAQNAGERFTITANPEFVDFDPRGGRLMVGNVIYATSL